jgi:S-adenosylmethionine hydrolase
VLSSKPSLVSVTNNAFKVPDNGWFYGCRNSGTKISVCKVRKMKKYIYNCKNFAFQ